MADGCHLDRNIGALVKEQTWTLERLDRFYAPDAPRPYGYFFRGVARRPEAG